MKLAKSALVGVTLVSGLAVAGIGHAGGNKYADAQATRDCGGGDTVVYNGPLKLWPPNHKFVPASATATDGNGGTTENPDNDTTLTITPTADDVAGGDGGAQHDPDWMYGDGSSGASSPTASGNPSATVPFSLRAERSGKGDGRTYVIDWKATFDGGSKTCTSMDSGQTPFEVVTPHDMRPSNR